MGLPCRLMFMWAVIIGIVLFLVFWPVQRTVSEHRRHPSAEPDDRDDPMGLWD